MSWSYRTALVILVAAALTGPSADSAVDVGHWAAGAKETAPAVRAPAIRTGPDTVNMA